MAFHSLGGDLQTSEPLRWVAGFIEAGLGTYQRQHAADAGGTLRALHVQFAIARALAPVALRTDVLATLKTHQAQGGDQRLGPRVVVVRGVAAGTGNPARGRRRSRPQTPQDFCSGAVHRTAHEPLDRFQIDPARFAAARENHLE